MGDIKEIKDKIDALSAEKQIEIGEYATKKGIHAKQAAALAGAMGSQQSLETQADTFCGVAIEQLTMSQKKLYRKLTEDQRKDMSQKVSINIREDETGGYIQFLKLQGNNTIAGKDIGSNLKQGADDAITTLGNGWELPRDVDYTDSNRLVLNPKESDYDAMIMQMPGATDNEKVENFTLLTGMSGWYRTAQNYNKSIPVFVVRNFSEGGRDRVRGSGNDYGPVRPVRSL